MECRNELTTPAYHNLVTINRIPEHPEQKADEQEKAQLISSQDLHLLSGYPSVYEDL